MASLGQSSVLKNFDLLVDQTVVSKIIKSLPLLIAITALARFIILQGKEMDPTALVYEAVAILLIAAAIVVLRLRHSDKLGLKKKKSK